MNQYAFALVQNGGAIGATFRDAQIDAVGRVIWRQAMLRANLGISFFYQATLTDRETQLAPIELKDFSLEHEVMFIFRKNSSFREDYEEIYAFLTNRENSQN